MFSSALCLLQNRGRVGSREAEAWRPAAVLLGRELRRLSEASSLLNSASDRQGCFRKRCWRAGTWRRGLILCQGRRLEGCRVLDLLWSKNRGLGMV